MRNALENTHFCLRLLNNPKNNTKTSLSGQILDIFLQYITFCNKYASILYDFKDYMYCLNEYKDNIFSNFIPMLVMNQYFLNHIELNLELNETLQ